MTEFDRSNVGPLPVGDGAGSEQARLLARRRWIKGGMSAPAVLTLMSGGPAAAASNACVNRAPTVTASGAAALMPATGALDVYLRTPLYRSSTDPTKVVFNLNLTGGLGGIYYGTTGPLPSVVVPGWSTWKIFGTIDGGGTITQTSPPYADGGSATGAALAYALIHYVVTPGPTGPTVSVVDIGGGTTGVAISGSCWASFSP